MTPKGTSEHDDRFRELLTREWRIDAELSPGFQDQVWKRIKRAELAENHCSPRATILPILERLFATPSIAFSYVIALFLAGLTIGWVQGQDESARMNKSMEQRYVQSVDPYQNPNH